MKFHWACPPSCHKLVLTPAHRITRRLVCCLPQVSPVVTAASSQSRADVLVIVLAAVLLLSGLQWLSIRPRSYDPVLPEGEELAYLGRELSPTARRDLQW